MPLYDGECSTHGKLIYYGLTPYDVECDQDGCKHILHYIPSFARVRGEGWFRSGYDVGLGVHLDSVQDRDRVMKEKHAVEKEGGGDINTGDGESKRGVIYGHARHKAS